MIDFPLLVDCDTGIDDAAALVYLVQSGADVVAITSALGNTSTHQGAANSAALLAAMARTDIPVAVGSEQRYDGSLPPYSPAVHGLTGTGTIELSGGVAPRQDAVTLIVDYARRYPGTLRILATGALTNLALALALAPELPTLVHSVTIMGGAAMAPGNVTPVAEANIERDPEAAEAVFASDLAITLVPLDVTMDHVIEDAERIALTRSSNLATRLVGQMLDSYMDFYVSIYGRRCAPLHDALAAGIAIGRVELALAPHASVQIDTSTGPGRGQTVIDLRHRFVGFHPATGVRQIALRTEDPFVPQLVKTLTSA